MVEQHIIDEIIRIHADNGWGTGIITRLIRRKFDIEIKWRVVQRIIDKYGKRTAKRLR